MILRKKSLFNLLARTLILTTILMVFGLVEIIAQASFTASGGTLTNSHGSVSYSIGQIASQSLGTTNRILEGVQQPYEISDIFVHNKNVDIQLVITVHPNPTTNIITLNVNNPDLSGMLFYVYAIDGKILIGESIYNRQTIINLSGLAPGTYLLKVLQESKNTSHIIDNQTSLIQTFKIIKN